MPLKTKLSAAEQKSLLALLKERFEKNMKRHKGISLTDVEALVNTSFEHAERLSYLVAQLPDSKLWELFVEEKYGNYYRNILGIIEHTHYHLGQIALVRKMLDNAKLTE
jgi:hypothetical protein